MSSKVNDVTLFSNGIGHFHRVYTVGKEESISIPFKSDCIGDVAASLQVFGKVRLESPPSFTPANSHSTALDIDQDNALKSLLTQLSGSNVKLAIRSHTTTEYRLLGLDSESVTTRDGKTEIFYVVAMRNGAIKRFLLSDVLDIEFEDEGVRTEIDKALKSNFQKIKPDSTLLDLALSSLDGEPVEAIVQYTIPVAAWKMRYALRQNKDGFNIEGAAIIDNNTDEDWNNFRISVVTGNPISFNTDIANVIVPQRRMVHLVEQQSAGNVNVSDAIAACSFDGGGGGGQYTRSASPSRYMAKSSVTQTASFGLESMMQPAANMVMPCIDIAAETAGVDSKDVGDFCIFTSKEPITILARKSAVVPMFNSPVKTAGVVLFYKESSNARRPFRSVKFKNETEYTLGRGKTVIYNEGVFSGECVLETTKPGETRMLPHCLENGVKIVKEHKGYETKRVSVKLSAGAGISEDVQTSQTNYVIENKKDEKFKVALEHNCRINQSTVTCEFNGPDIKEKEKLADGNGWRVYFELGPKESVTLSVSETYVAQSTTNFGGDFWWIKQNVIDQKSPLSSNEDIKRCLDIQRQIDDLVERHNNAEEKVEQLNEQVVRVRSNLEAAKSVAASKKVDAWIDDLDNSETQIRELTEKTIPKLTKDRMNLQSKMAEELSKLTATWELAPAKAVKK